MYQSVYDSLWLAAGAFALCMTLLHISAVDSLKNTVKQQGRELGFLESQLKEIKKKSEPGEAEKLDRAK